MLKLNEQQRNERKYKAYELRCMGMSHLQISYELGCSQANAIALIDEVQKERLSKQETNLNILRDIRLAELDKMRLSRWNDLLSCGNIVGEDGKILRDGMKMRGIIINDLIKISQETCKLTALYTPEKVEAFIAKKIESDEQTLDVDYTSMSNEELAEMFAIKMREQA